MEGKEAARPLPYSTNLASNSPLDARKTMAELENRRINLARQAELLSVNRTSLYRLPPTTEWSELDLDDMRLIDEIYTAHPYYGYRRIAEQMQRCGRQINRKRVRRLMRIMGIQGICPGPNLLTAGTVPNVIRSRTRG